MNLREVQLPLGLYPDPKNPNQYYKTHRSAYTWFGLFIFTGALVGIGFVVPKVIAGAIFMLIPIAILVIIMIAAIYCWVHFMWTKMIFDIPSKTCIYVTGYFPAILCQSPEYSVPIEEVLNGIHQHMILKARQRNPARYECRSASSSGASAPPIILGSEESNKQNIETTISVWRNWLSHAGGLHNRPNPPPPPGSPYTDVNNGFTTSSSISMAGSSTSLAQPMLFDSMMTTMDNVGLPSTNPAPAPTQPAAVNPNRPPSSKKPMATKKAAAPPPSQRTATANANRPSSGGMQINFASAPNQNDFNNL